MPPKTNSGASKKTVEKQKTKVIEDKTFGLKNKKGAKTQQFIQQVVKNVQAKGAPPRRDPLAPETAQDKKAKEKAKEEELKELFKPVIQSQKVAKDVDPKSVLCAFYKAGTCGKGDKCKFSHDLNIERKTEKRNLYNDDRAKEEDKMENWDDATLQDVVNKKHSEGEALKPKTDIVCKHFLAAIEDNKYGWFWECPNGGEKCMYKHALPPGFVLKKDKKRMEEMEEKISLEDLIEKERAALGGNLTKVTLETFRAWKIKKRKERLEKLESDKKKKENEYQAGRLNGLSGRDMFTFNPEMAVQDDDEATDDIVYKAESDDEQENVTARAIDESLFIEEEVDTTGTISNSRDRHGATSHLPVTEGGDAPGTSGGVLVDDVPVDADLFDEDDCDEEESGQGDDDASDDPSQ
ncbi:hypothetical protein RvY_00290 [Ramazzottius varieornatus]|uniref:C3H1-type domain-containing protein n=1 Tax=Ramazzottius varieornatus TaxID=947166 RepID=A0A1D1UCA6_RAMVA|nr:hypothetical protein RvY_00290 [Ramazzottius varieornatus]